MKRVFSSLSILAALAVGLPSTGSAQIAQGPTVPGTWLVPGNSLIATGPDVWVRFFGADASYTSQLVYCTALGECSDAILFQNNTPDQFSAGQEVHLNGTFAAGQEIIFKLFVTNTGDSWFTDTSGNSDNVAHFATQDINDVTDNAAYTVLGGFEDKKGGGDRDYNDLMFEFGGVQTAVTATPEPATIAMVAPALVGLGGVVQRRRRNKKNASAA